MTGQEAVELIRQEAWTGRKPGLSRTRELLKRVGNPHQKLKYVHITGTNGKGSTAAMVASVLDQAGLTVSGQTALPGRTGSAPAAAATPPGPLAADPARPCLAGSDLESADRRLRSEADRRPSRRHSTALLCIFPAPGPLRYHRTTVFRLCRPCQRGRARVL